MLNYIKSLFIPKVETPAMIVAREVNETSIDLLKASKELEYWHSQCQMLDQRGKRLLELTKRVN
jgi:hypothetical protein